MQARTDRELVESYAATQDEAAFAELVSRYSPMVYRVCQRWLGHAHEAEDAAQAVFIVLARKAGSLRTEVKMSGWLYRVARHVALQGLRRRAKHTRQQAQAAFWQESVAAAAPPPDTAALLRHIDTELDSLSAILREAVVLRHLRGLSEKEAALAAGCPVSAMKWRTSEGLTKLRARLNQRGLALNSAALLGLLQAATQTAVPATLPAAILATVKSVAGTGAATAAGSAKALTLAKGVLKTLFWAKVKTAAVAVAVTGFVVGGGLVAHRALAHRAAVPAAKAKVPAVAGGRVWAWGDNQFGQLGDGTTNQRATPVPVPSLDGVMAVAAGAGHTLALRGDRTVWAWGHNNCGQLGNGATNNSPLPVAVPGLAGVIAVAAGFEHTVALKSDRTVWAWGGNRYGQLGNGTTTSSPVPVAVPGLAGVIAIAAGATHTVAVKRDRTVWAWGNNASGQLGDGTTTPRLAPVPVRLKDGTPLTGVIAVAAGDRHTVALRDDHTVWAWGYNFYGAVGNGDIGMTPVVTPVPIPDIAGVSAIAAGRRFTLALGDGGKVWTWGSYYGVGPVETYAAELVKTAAGSPLSGITAIAPGESHAVALAADGGLWTWGKDSATAIPVHVPAAAAAGITASAAGGGHTVVVVTKR